MDRNAPEALRDTAERGYRESRALLERWHGRGRLAYAITPRFALTSSGPQLEVAGALLREFPSAYLQTHLAENPDEIATVARAVSDGAQLHRRLRSLWPARPTLDLRPLPASG